MGWALIGVSLAIFVTIIVVVLVATRPRNKVDQRKQDSAE